MLQLNVVCKQMLLLQAFSHHQAQTPGVLSSPERVSPDVVDRQGVAEATQTEVRLLLEERLPATHVEK